MIAHGKTPAIDIQELYLGISSFTAARWIPMDDTWRARSLVLYRPNWHHSLWHSLLEEKIFFFSRRDGCLLGLLWTLNRLGSTVYTQWTYGTSTDSKFKDCFEQIQNRTNNGLERFNRTLNQLFDHQTPSLPVFVEKIKEISSQTLQNLDDIKNFRKQPHQREVMGYLVVEDAYYDFKDSLA